MFDLPMVIGSGSSIRDPKNIIINETLAKILFGENEAFGKTISIYNGSESMTLVVSGIFKDLPMISSFNFSALTGLDNYIKLNKIEEHSWGDWVGATFIKVSDAQRIPLIHEHLKSFVALQNDANKGFPVESFFIERMKDIPQSGRNMGYYWLRPGIHPAIIYFSATMGFIILLLACINFMNTSLAISSRRLKEVGISKVLGGIRRHTIFQFLGENIILCFIALFFALTISPFLIDAWSTPFANLDLNMSFLNGLRFWIFLVVLLILTAILSGAYPSFYMARFSPVKILKGSVKFKSGGWFSKILLILQFLLATISIVAAVIFIQNAYYQSNLDLGYEEDNLIVVSFQDPSNLSAVKNQISQNPLINKVGVAREHIQYHNYLESFKNAEQEREVEVLTVGQGYFETVGIELLEGRSFDQEFKETDREKAVMVNEKLAEEYGWKEAVGQQLRLNDTTVYNVIGLMKNFNLHGFETETRSVLFKLGIKEQMQLMLVNANAEHLIEVNKAIKKEWEQIIINKPYSGFFQSEKLVEEKTSNKFIIQVMIFLGLISLMLSLSGLYTMVSLSIIRKTKEIGIRKVLGVSMRSLIGQVSREFIILVLIGSLAGASVGAYLSFMMMDFISAYHVDFNLLSVIIPVLLILIISILTLSVKVYKSANRNPVESLKYE